MDLQQIAKFLKIKNWKKFKFYIHEINVLHITYMYVYVCVCIVSI